MDLPRFRLPGLTPNAPSPNHENVHIPMEIRGRKRGFVARFSTSQRLYPRGGRQSGQAPSSTGSPLTNNIQQQKYTIAEEMLADK